MQSEFACHVGMNGNLFCRICLANFGKDSDAAQQVEKAPTSSLSYAVAGSRNASNNINDNDSRSEVGCNGSITGVLEDPNKGVCTFKMSDWVRRA